MSKAAFLPTEILRLIYLQLSPHDFNAARHSCLQWMTASLDLKLLAEHLRRGGWWSKAATESYIFEEWRTTWPMSGFLARECALAGDWTGNGCSVNTKYPSCKPMIRACQADFSGLRHPSVEEDGTRSSDDTVCAVSLCGRFFAIASDRTIIVYNVDGILLRLVARVRCETAVIAISLDASADNFVIAAILEGRIGLYVDLLSKPSPPADSSWENPIMLNPLCTDSSAVMDFGTDNGSVSASGGPTREVNVGELDELSVNAESIGSRDIMHQSVELAPNLHWSHYYHGRRARLRGMRHMPTSSNGVWPHALTFSEGKSTTGGLHCPQAIYRNVCTEEDPPTSVAISPIRQCVAFGCRNGVELYWVLISLSNWKRSYDMLIPRGQVDPTTGQNLNRWFPLTRPSDHLYFLPPRRNIDSPLRLRLISTPSRGRPPMQNYDSSTISTRQSNLWSTVTSTWRFSPTRPAPDVNHVDHSYALPLSDGHHLLFMDDGSGRLCLGSDQPASSVQRLSRKILFEPPGGQSGRNSAVAPKVYAVSSYLDNGVRLAAVYNDNIILYSIPIDAIRYSTAEQEQTIQDPSVPFEELEWIDVLQHPTSNANSVAQSVPEATQTPRRTSRLNMSWVHYLPSAFEDRKADSLDTLWPIKIRGTHIGSLSEVRALAVQEDETDGLVVWAFSGLGTAKAWKVDDGKRAAALLHYSVDGDGAVW